MDLILYWWLKVDCCLPSWFTFTSFADIWILDPIPAQFLTRFAPPIV
jgi:hypothetical protein